MSLTDFCRELGRLDLIYKLGLLSISACVLYLFFFRDLQVLSPGGVHLYERLQSQSLEYVQLYDKYRDGLRNLRGMMKRFCRRAKPSGFPHLGTCLTGTLEQEILYLRIRHLRPNYVLEASSATGYSTMVILQALGDNGRGRLISVDVFETPFPRELHENLRSRWNFVKGDMRETVPNILHSHSFDYLHVDTCHDEECIQWYLRNIVQKIRWSPNGSLHASFHDIFKCFDNDPQGLSDEGALVLQHILHSSTQKTHGLCFGGENSIYAGIQRKRGEIFGQREARQLIGGLPELWKKRDYISTLYTCFV